MTHALKIWPEYYSEVDAGIKTFELRKDDRPFRNGDTVLLQEWNPTTKEYTGKESSFYISYILRNVPNMGLKPGYCILQLKEKEI